MKTYSLKIQSSRKNLTKVEELLHKVNKEANLNNYTFNNLMTAVSEAVLNAIVHGNKENEKKNVEINIILNGSALTVKVQDEGNGMNKKKANEPGLPDDPLNLSGRGLYIVKALVDEVDYEHTDKGFCCIMKVKK